MPIKYGEFTCFYNNDILSNMFLFFYNINYCDSEVYKMSNLIIISFEDDDHKYTIDGKYVCNQSNINIVTKTKQPLFRSVFTKDTNMYTTKSPTKNANGVLQLSFSHLFSSYKNYNIRRMVSSFYNTIWFKNLDLNNESFCIVYTTSSKYTPTFWFAYDSDEFTKEDVIYLLQTIFMK